MKSKEQYLFEYESLLKQADIAKKKLNDLPIQKQFLLTQHNNAEQILLVDNQVNALSLELEQLNGQTIVYKDELNGLSQEDNALKQKVLNLEQQYQLLQKEGDKYDQTFTDIMIILNGFSAKEGLKLNQVDELVKILPADELMHTDILKKACEMNHREEFDKVIEKITDINFQDKEGKTILMHAIRNGFYYGVDKLLARGTDVNLFDDKDANALMHCAQNPHTKYIKIISERTTDIDQKGPDGNTALHLLMSNVRKVIFTSELPELDCDLSYLGGTTIVAEGGNIGAINVANQREGDSYTIGQHKALRIIKDLSANKANLGLQNDQGQTPFAIACVQQLKYLTAQLLKDHEGQLNIDARDVNDNTALHFAAVLPEPEDVIEPLLKRFDINVKNKFGHTPIVEAISNNKKSMVEFLLKSGANIYTEDGLHLWHHASIYGMTELLKFFNDKIPNIDFLTKTTEQTALWLASQHGHLDSVKWLIDQNADINRQSNGATSIYAAVANNRYEVAKFLLDAKADTNIYDTEGAYPLHVVTSYGLLDMVNLLVKYCNINARTANEHQLTALWLAAQDGKLEIVKVLADHGADLNIPRATNGIPPLYAAIQKQHIPVAIELLARGADVNVVIAGGWIALHCAATLKDVTIAQTILEKETNINAQNNGGGTPLYVGVCNNNNPVTKLLIDSGADANIPDNGGIYPWHQAGFNGFLDVMKTLAPKTNVDCKTANADQYTALWYASQQGHLETVKWLISIDADVNAARESDGRTALQAAICGKNLPVVQELVEHGAEVNKANLKQFAPIYQAVELEELKIIKFLIEHNANINLAGDSGDQPIHMASMLCNIFIMKILIERGASIDTINNSGNTPLHEVLLEENTTEPDKKVNAVKYLLAKSAKTDIKNIKGETAIDLAQHHFQETLPWLEHPENLPPLHQLESNLIGNFSYAEL